MMQTTVRGELVEPYAEALLSLAQTHNLIDQFQQDTQLILELLASSSELQQFLANPLIKPEAKKNVLRQLTVEKVHGYFLNFLMLLVDRRRINFLGPICEQYRALVRKLRNVVLAEVTSAVELNDDQRRAVVEKVKAMTGAADVELVTACDPELIGGVVIKVGSQIFDASLRGQLRRLSLTLAQAA
ncbi:ATP synthase F1 subunit delta [Thermosynechococcus sp. JY1334]|uniref:ATP synthase F1 subunit delta n=1 Tax=unclassified Thermosynechococcus TaxID=2622553 RepID=UPI00267271D9|nr:MULTISPECIES: ATP synthase F1 subunit delta [unclassified Thermosynechococcus]MDR7898274.1 ATP synthase F1 subunit delta [Thermosynechococcus sp. JY1332]MDR7905676.1 ATP synthase F1 subunit delta [Thermosynechococcus sp. JY1334]MDR7993507.1 ATP synthase F1 subunit delta [Thermosynechococcus sp. TG252]WKT80215.1 ATP synthase F1 subunit delta [Thermosynechococcus sp. PP45]WKT85403.1 ATP synthase F1 subunit delta [Thermosynechococcus sp. JY1339]